MLGHALGIVTLSLTPISSELGIWILLALVAGFGDGLVSPSANMLTAKLSGGGIIRDHGGENSETLFDVEAKGKVLKLGEEPVNEHPQPDKWCAR